ncbi:MAG: fasciclin domain-containing protein [Fimbriimonas sp.]|jgi:uncharacterized surface protein with fasciclin (FAS1) repeats|nr:fasciclin domain-containing protein [Fimbriimonas sp.]
MKIRTSILSLSAILLVAAIPARTNEKDIVDTAVAAGSFKTLVKLVKDAGLVETLKSEGPFTVLAPTDEAFAKVPKAVLKKLAGNKALLKSVLTYHVISGKVLSTDLKEGSVATVQGEKVKINLHGGAFFNKSKVVKADIMTSNGVIHVIDSVLLPPTVAAKL